MSVKLAQPFPAPELRTRILRTREDFSEFFLHKSRNNLVAANESLENFAFVSGKPC